MIRRGEKESDIEKARKRKIGRMSTRHTERRKRERKHDMKKREKEKGER